MDIHIAPHGTDAGAGTAGDPLATLDGARARLRQLAGTIGSAPVIVWLHGGTYRLARGFCLDATDALPVPLSFRAWPGDEVRISGARPLSADAFVRVDDPAIVARLDPAARGQVVRIDLAALGLHERAPLRSHGFAFPELPSDPELFIADQPMPIARWPKSGALLITTVPDQGTLMHERPVRGATFTCDDPRVARWGAARHAICHGQWANDWAPSTVPVRSIDGASGTIMLGAPSQYGVRSEKRFVMMNLLEEIGEPGEWYVDRDDGMLYLWPPHALAGARIELSWLEEPLLSLRDVRHVSFHDLTIECTRGIGVVLDGAGNRLIGCELRNLGRNAVSVRGEDNGVVGCHVHDCGQGGIFLDGGNRKTLTPGGNFAENNHIHAFNRIVRTYQPGIMFDGVGHRAYRNLIHDAPHFGIQLRGNDHLIEGNEFCDVCLDTDDAGAFYMGRNPSERGIVLRGNFFHHVGSGRDCGTSAIYIDDGAGGVLVEGNVFFRTGSRGILGMGAICINSGKDVHIERNIFCECPRAVGVLLTTQEGWERSMSDLDPGGNEMLEQYHGHLYRAVDIRLPPYSTRYPELATLKQNASRNRIYRNIVDRCDEFVLGLAVQDAVDNRIIDADPGYRDPLHLDFTLPGHPATTAMGLDAASFRFAVPDLRNRLDLRVTLDGRPQREADQPEASGTLTVHVVNRSQRPVSTTLEIHGSPVPITVAGGSTVPVALAPGAAAAFSRSFRAKPLHNHELYLCAREARRDAISAFVQAEVQVLHRLNRIDDAAALATQSPMPFIDDANRVVARLHLAMVGDELAVLARIDDPRAVAGAQPWRTSSDIWQGPFLGLYLDTPIPSCIRQLVFCPAGPSGDELCYLRGPDRHPAPALSWNARALPTGGYELSARIPLSVVGIDPASRAIRLQGMVHIPGSRILPLVGMNTAFNDSRRHALLDIGG